MRLQLGQPAQGTGFQLWNGHSLKDLLQQLVLARSSGSISDCWLAVDTGPFNREMKFEAGAKTTVSGL